MKRHRPVEAILHGAEEDQFRQLDQPGVDLDLTFLPVEQMVILREKLPGPDPHEMSCKTYVQLNLKNSSFVNLQGLEDNSLLLSIQINKAGKDLKPQQKYNRYWPDIARSKVYSDLVKCSWSHMMLHIVLPESRIRGWKTVALILRTFRRISADTWNWLVRLEDPPAVKGLDWREIESGGEFGKENERERLETI